MKIRFPKPLAPSDLIAVAAPSSGVPAPLHARLDRAIAALTARGYRVVEGACLRHQYKNASASREQRASELMRFLRDPNVAAIMPPWGGELAIEILELLDFDALRDASPKWFSGFSDLSTIHLPLATIAGWATLHGPNLMELGAREIDPVTSSIWKMMESTAETTVSQSSSEKFQIRGVDWAVEQDAGYVLQAETAWKRLDAASEELAFKGRLIGGCLDSIARLAGTPFGDVPRFIDAHRNEGVILYLENAEMRPCELTRALHGLRLNGWFNGLSGILVGRNAAPDAAGADSHSYLDALRSAFDGLSCPILYDVDVGHVPPQLSLVNGAYAQVEFRDRHGRVHQRIGS